MWSRHNGRLFCSQRRKESVIVNANLLKMADRMALEKGIPKETILEYIQDAYLSAAKKICVPSRGLQVRIDSRSGELQAISRPLVVEKVDSEHDEISLDQARKIRTDAQVGEEVEMVFSAKEFGRIGSQTVRQALNQILQRDRKQQIQRLFQDRKGDIVSGYVHEFRSSNVILELDPEKILAVLPSSERVPSEDYQRGDRIRCYIKAIEDYANGPDIVLSRSDPEFITKLFKMEVAEINDGTIEIKSVAREAGFRTKLAVWSNNPKVDPVGACVGLRGQRVKNIVRELNNERIDIIPWDTDLRTLVTNALSPVSILAFEFDEVTRRAKIQVKPEQLSLAIGKKGLNARLTSRLCKCHIDIQPRKTAELGFAEKVARTVDAFAAIDGISREQATILVNSGFHTLNDLLHAELEDLRNIAELGADAERILESVKKESTRRLSKLEEIH